MLKKLFIAGVASLACFASSVSAQSRPSPANVFTKQYTCTSTPTAILTAAPGYIQSVFIEQTGSTAVYFGNSSVTSSNGFPLIGSPSNTVVQLYFAGSLYCVTASGTTTIAILWTF